MATLRRLRDFVRANAGIKGSDTFIALIDNTINEVLTDKTALAICPELRVNKHQIAAVGSDNPAFNLPTDLQHFIKERVFFGNTSDGFERACRLFESSQLNMSEGGEPRKYQRVGLTLQVFPYVGSVTLGSSVVWIDYYKAHTTLVNDTDAFPIPALENVVKLEAVARMARYGDTKLAAAFQSDADRAWNSFRAITGR